MQCSRCHVENREDRRFCGDCGFSFASDCPSCGFRNEGGEKFCGGCGRSLTVPSTRDEQRFPSPHAYTPTHLAEKILTSKSALEGERKQVTVLFADTKGSMELLADRDPEDARKILDPILECMMEAVHRYEGTVNQVMGDGIMALFGAPLAHEDHAVRGCYAALRMQESVNQYAEEVRRTIGVPVHIRVGLNSGEVVVRVIRSDLHMDYTAVGQTTHCAARMEQMAMPGSILISSSTFRLAEDFVQVKPLGRMAIKGLDAPIEVYEVAGAGPMRSRIAATATRGFTRFVGRESEIETLRRVLDGVSAGHGQVLAVIGEPGVGKSRLLWEFIHSHLAHGWLVLESNSASFGKSIPYYPVIDLLKTYFHIEARDDARKVGEKLNGKLVTLDPSLQTALPGFLALLDVPADDAQWHSLDPARRRHRILEGLKRLLLRESQVQPLCLAIEDLHWIDSETQGFLDSLIESIPNAQILLLINYRPEYSHNWGSKTYYNQLRIDPLPRQSAEQFLGALLGEDPGLQRLKQLLITQTQGNPFFLEEGVRSLVETGTFVGEPGSYRLATALPPRIQIPATVQTVLAARIDRLSPNDKRLLQTTAVIGEEFPYVLLRAIADMSEEALRQGISRLQTAEFIYETRLFPDREYSFKHGLTYQVAYGTLLQERRRALHSQIVEALERLYPDRLSEHIERLAHHALHGEMWAKAVTYLRRAGTKAAASSAHREAARSFEQALAALKHLPESSELLGQAIDVRFELRNSLHPLGELSLILDHLHEAEKLAETLNDQRRLGQVFTLKTQYFRILGDHDRAVESGQRAVAIAERLDDLALRIAANTVLGPAYGTLGDYRNAIQILQRNVELLRRTSVRETFTAGLQSVFSRVYLVGFLAELGEFVEGIAQAEEAMQIAKVSEHTYSLTFAHFGIGSVYLLQGELQGAIPALERGLQFCRTLNLAVMFPLFASSLGSAYALSGRPAEALPLLEEAVTQAASMRRMGGHAGLVVRFGEGCLLAGRLDDAARLADSALPLSRALKERGCEAYALRLVGEVAAQRERHDSGAAESYYWQALKLATELGMRPLLGRCHVSLGKLYGGMRRDADADQHLATAAALFRELAMRPVVAD